MHVGSGRSKEKKNAQHSLQQQTEIESLVLGARLILLAPLFGNLPS